MDTVRMIAYRSETAMAGLMIDSAVKMVDARRLLQTLFVTEADILPDVQNNLLRVRVHNASTQADNRIITVLLDELNKAEVKYPGTNLRLIYELVNKAI